MTLRLAPYGVLLVALLAPASAAAAGDSGKAPSPGEQQEAAMRSPGEQLTITGVRTTQGSAVDCPTVVTADGESISVAALPASVAIGDTVTVSGVMAPITTCVGLVLVARSVEIVARGSGATPR